MIKINGIFVGGLFVPERELTDQEKEGITSTLTNGADNTITYFYGDEPNEEGVETKYREVASWKVKSILKIQNLYNLIEDALSQLPEPTKTIAGMAWQHSESINQFSPTVQMIKSVCNLTDEQVEEIFTQAEQINI